MMLETRSMTMTNHNHHHHLKVRGATLELLDITYDGEEDSVTGVLSGGLGQLVIIIVIIIMRMDKDSEIARLY